jgi:hypothetical protein
MQEAWREVTTKIPRTSSSKGPVPPAACRFIGEFFSNGSAEVTLHPQLPDAELGSLSHKVTSGRSTAKYETKSFVLLSSISNAKVGSLSFADLPDPSVRLSFRTKAFHSISAENDDPKSDDRGGSATCCDVPHDATAANITLHPVPAEATDHRVRRHAEEISALCFPERPETINRVQYVPGSPPWMTPKCPGTLQRMSKPLFRSMMDRYLTELMLLLKGGPRTVFWTYCDGGDLTEEHGRKPSPLVAGNAARPKRRELLEPQAAGFRRPATLSFGEESQGEEPD